MFLSSLDMKGGKFISVYPFSAELPASSGNLRSLNFRVTTVRDINCERVCQKAIFLSRNFLPILEVKVLGKVRM